jgi:hypothetical protein
VRKQTQTHERTVHSRNVSCGHESQGVDEFPAIAFVTIAPKGRCWPAASNPLQNLHVLDYPRTPHRPRGCSYAPQLFRRSEKHYHYYYYHQKISQSRCSMQAQVPGGAGVLPESLNHSAPACLPACLPGCLPAGAPRTPVAHNRSSDTLPPLNCVCVCVRARATGGYRGVDDAVTGPGIAFMDTRPLLLLLLLHRCCWDAHARSSTVGAERQRVCVHASGVVQRRRIPVGYSRVGYGD